jgi:hypothetical protein
VNTRNDIRPATRAALGCAAGTKGAKKKLNPLGAG